MEQLGSQDIEDALAPVRERAQSRKLVVEDGAELP